MSIGLSKECFSKINWLNKSDGDFGTIATGLSPSLHYLIISIEEGTLDKIGQNLWNDL